MKVVIGLQEKAKNVMPIIGFLLKMDMLLRHLYKIVWPRLHMSYAKRVCFTPISKSYLNH
jgi:hypothetical protein